jgi:DNA (cytosine-5)-methyltransferase 1
MHNNTPIVPYVSLCSGYEGIGLGLHRCIPNLRCIAYCEREAFAISNLVAKMENGLLDAAPVFTDVTTFPWEQYAPYMAGGILSFGWPCQPVSCAGKRKATEDERWLFDIIADGIALMRPGLLFAENVEGLLSAKMPDGSLVFSHCIERLESLHYKVAAGIFSASEVGAPHQRKRVFILAHRSDSGLQRREWFRQTRAQGESSGYASECGSTMACSTNWRGEGLHDGNAEPEDALTRCAWPSRPGEPQHAWEPPRVVGAVATKLADFCSRDSQSGGDTAQASGESVGEWREGADPNADGGSSVCGGDQGDEQAGMAHTHSCGGEEPEHQQANLSSEPSRGHAEAMGNAVRIHEHKSCGGGSQQHESWDASEAMGNAKQFLLPATREHGAMDEASGIPTDREGCESAQADPEPSAARKREGNWADASERGQAQPSLGRDADGPAGGLGYAELCVSCDNRTDELRLLGNGVVPATATRAFVTLMKELSQ